MSISGTGTQADPYVVDTWADFVTAIGNSNAYVEVDTSIINTWDFAKTVEGGITTAVSWNASNVNGNGLTIKGIYGSGVNQFFNNSTSTQKYVYNINLIDFAKSSDVSNFIAGKNWTFGNCKFSGIVDGGNFISHSTSTPRGSWTFTTGVFEGIARGCSFALQFKNGALFCNSELAIIQHGNMNFIADEATATQTLKMYESKISGAMPWTNFTNAGGGQNVIDADISSIGTWSNTSGGVTLVNTDKLATGLSVPSGFTGVTSSQMLDVDALAAVGFTAYPEEEPEPEEPEENEGGEGE